MISSRPFNFLAIKVLCAQAGSTIKIKQQKSKMQVRNTHDRRMIHKDGNDLKKWRVVSKIEIVWLELITSFGFESASLFNRAAKDSSRAFEGAIGFEFELGWIRNVGSVLWCSHDLNRDKLCRDGSLVLYAFRCFEIMPMR